MEEAPQIENPGKITLEEFAELVKQMRHNQRRYFAQRRPELRRMPCRAVRRFDGKCIRGKNGNMLVEFPGVGNCVVLGKLLRKIKKQKEKLLEIANYTLYLQHETKRSILKRV